MSGKGEVDRHQFFLYKKIDTHLNFFGFFINICLFIMKLSRKRKEMRR